MAPGIETAILQMAVGQIPMGKLPSTKKVEASPLPPTQYSNPAYRRRQAAGQEAPSRGGESPSLPLFQGPLVGRDTTSMFSSLEQQGAQSLVVLLDKSFQTGDAEPLRAFLINRARQLPVNGPTDKSREDAISRLENRDSKAILRDGVAELILLLNNTGSRDGAVFAFNLSYILRQLNSNCSDVAINDLRLKSAEEELAKFFAWPGLLKDGQILKAFQQSAYYDSMGQGTYNLFINEDSLKDSLKNAKKTAEFCAPRLSAINEAYYKSLSSSVRFFTQAYRDHLEGKDELAIERLKTSLVYLDSDNVLSFKMLDSEREMQYQRKQLEQSLAEGQLSVDRSVANINIVDQVAPNLGAVSALFAGYRLPWMLLYVAALRAFKQGVNAFSREHNFGVPHAEAWSDARQRFIEQYSRDVVDLTAARLTRSFLSFSAAPGPESAGGLLFRSGRSLGGLWPARTQISNLERVVPGVAETLAARRATFGGVAFNLFSAPPHAAIDHLSGNRRFNAGSFLMVDLLLGSGIAGFSSKLSGINATRQTNLYSWAIKEGSPTRTLAFWSYYILTETAEWFADIFGSGVAATIRKNTASPAYDSTNPDTYPAMFGLNSDEMAQVVFQSAVRRSISSQVAISSMVAHGQARAFRDFAEAELQQRARQLQQDLKGGGPDWSVNIALAKEVDSASPSSNQARLSWPEHIFGPKRGSFALTQSDNNFPNFWAREARLRLARTPEERQNLLLQWGAAPTFGERFANLLLPRPSLDLAAIHKLGLVSGRAVEHQVVDATLKRFGAPQDKAGMGPLTEQVKTRVES